MSFYSLLKSRRSIRGFQNKRVEKEKIDVILKSALLSPSSRSRRPWEFIVGIVFQNLLLIRITCVCPKKESLIFIKIIL